MLYIEPFRIWLYRRTASLCLGEDSVIYFLPPGPCSGYYKPAIIGLKSIYNYTRGWFWRRRIGVKL